MVIDRWKPNRPYNELPPLPPKVEIESKAILKACITARAALAELKQAAELIPNQGVLINTLPLLEAGASSEIENIVTTTDKLFEHMRNEAQADPATKEALRYSHAVLEAFKTLSKYPLTTRTAEQICTRIKAVEMSVRRTPGTALKNTATGEIIYNPAGRRIIVAGFVGGLGAIFAQRNRAGSADTHGDWPLSIRGNSPIYRW